MSGFVTESRSKGCKRKNQYSRWITANIYHKQLVPVTWPFPRCSFLFVSLPNTQVKEGERKAVISTHARWSKLHNRPLTGSEMLAAMGLPVAEELAKGIGVPQPNLSGLKSNAKAGPRFHSLLSYEFVESQAFLAGNGMDIPCVGFALLCVTWRVSSDVWLVKRVVSQALVCLQPIEDKTCRS